MFLVFLYLMGDVRFMDYLSPGQFIGWPGSGGVGGGGPGGYPQPAPTDLLLQPGSREPRHVTR